MWAQIPTYLRSRGVRASSLACPETSKCCWGDLSSSQFQAAGEPLFSFPLSPEASYNSFSIHNLPHLITIGLPVPPSLLIKYWGIIFPPLLSKKLSNNSPGLWIPDPALMTLEILRAGNPALLIFVIVRGPVRIYSVSPFIKSAQYIIIYTHVTSQKKKIG